MGDVVLFRSKAEGKTIQQLQTEGLDGDLANVCVHLLAEFHAVGLPPPFIRGGRGGFLMMWLFPDHTVGLEAPNKGGTLWSIHHHDARGEIISCFEQPFAYTGDNKSIARALKELIAPVDQ